MNEKRRHVLLAILFVASFVTGSLAQAERGMDPRKQLAADLRASLQRARREARWRSPTAMQRTALRDAMAYAVRRAADRCDAVSARELRQMLDGAGFELLELEQGKDRVWVLQEKEGAHRGGGLYAVRCGRAGSWALQAPHGSFDLGTREIVLRLFVQSDARIAFWNTVQRYRSHRHERPTDPVHPADVAHQHGSRFQAATLGAHVAAPDLRFVQIHGAELPNSWDAVVSFGALPQRPEAIGAALKPVLGRVAVYRQDIRHLGGTTNVQGELLARSGKRLFLHLELSHALRQRLKRSSALRERLAAVLRKPW